MKLYDSTRAPNPRRLRIFLAEKGVSVPTEQVDLVGLQHKTSAYAEINPVQRIPALVLDDGTVITESLAICRYFEWLHPEPRLFGREGLDAALVDMWQRRVDFHLFTAVSQAFRHLHPSMKDMEVPQVPAWGEANKSHALDFLPVLDRQLRDHRFVAGDRYSVADITALVAVDFMKPAKIAMPEGLGHLARWHAEVSARPSAAA